ncbi:MAG TPA: MerR family transcriptional regulator [Mucilaginibacter sp.]|jgi:DNA-binding transcriptional MerR regulator
MEEKKISPADANVLMDVDFLVSVIVAIGEVANITGVPQRKIRYWDEKGYIEPVDKDSTYRQYDYLNIKRIVMIKEMLDEGYTLEVSAKKVIERCIKVEEVFQRLKNKSHKS